MDVKLLIDAIVRQTTVLIAQLSTAAGIRAPLAHVADQVFFELASEIEAQGVARKVAADMFGLALRSYQKKMQRLTESASARDKTLWEAVIEFLSQQGSATRERVVARFKHDSERDVAAVLSDLVGQGLVYSTGRGASAIYGLSSDADRSRMLQKTKGDSLQSMIWLSLYRKPMSRAELASALSLDEAAIDAALAALVAEGRARDEDGRFRAETFLVPVGSERGWEVAVFDHFSAVARAIAAKVRQGTLRSEASDVVGGATLTFEIDAGHALENEVLGLLSRVRKDVNELWGRVAAENLKRPLVEKDIRRVTFYFGQNLDDAEDGGRGEIT
jgi:hypothetical protein